ncbi:MAG: hypothetical protein J0M17_08335 [Planctomycetes bacterium]|nr:hypothetical protein [Planctomycetota bacterium]
MPQLREFGESLHIAGIAQIDLETELEWFWKRWHQTFNDPQFAEYFDVDPEYPSAPNAKFLAPVRGWGSMVFKRLFRDLEITNHPGAVATKIRGLLLKTLASSRRSIHVASNMNQVLGAATPGPRTFPWNFLYQDPEPGSRNWQDGFWGFRHHIEEAFTPPPSFKGLRPNPTILATIDRRNDPRGYHSDPTHPFHAADKSCVVVEARDAQDLLRRLSDTDADVIYHFGHHYDRGSVVDRRLRWEENEVTLYDVESSGCPQYRSDSVLVFLNACESGACDPTMSDTFLGRLCTRRKTHCIATWTRTPWSVGARFSKSFWRLFLKERRNAGEAVLEARRELRDDAHRPNPLGLLYCYFGSLLLEAGNAR